MSNFWHLKHTLNKLKKEKKKLIAITGDFNLNLLKYGDDTSSTKFLNLMLEQQFQPCITGPSRILDYNSPSLIDNIFIHNITNPISGNILEKISFDHLPNFISFKAKNPTPTHTRFKIRDMSKFDSTKFREDLQAIDLLDYPHLNTDELASLFHKHFMESYNLHAPIKILSKKASKTKLKPWLTEGILKSINVKRSLLKKYDRSKNNSFLTKYRQYRHLLKKLIKKSKKNYYKIFFSENANNIKKTWKQLNNILNKHKKNQQYVDCRGVRTCSPELKNGSKASGLIKEEGSSTLLKKIVEPFLILSACLSFKAQGCER